MAKLREAVTKLTGPTAPHRIAVDPGNATTIGAFEGKVTTVFPSTIATFGIGPYTGDPVLRRDGGHISWNGNHAVIGCEALRHIGYDTLRRVGDADDWRRYTSEHSIMTLLAAVGSAVPEPEYVSVELGTGVPKTLEPHTATIAKALTGSYEFVHHGRPRTVEIVKAHVFIQGAEIFRLLTPDQRSGDVALHDMGGKDYGVHGIRDGAYRGGKSYDLGFDQILDGIPGISPDPGVRLEKLRQMAANPKHEPTLRKEIIDKVIGAIRIAAVKSPLARVEKHVVISGSAWALAEALRQEYKQAQVVALPDGVGANALSYLKAMEAQ